MARREAVGQINLFDIYRDLENFNPTLADVPIQRETIIKQQNDDTSLKVDRLLDEDDKPIGTTSTGLALYGSDDPSLMYSVDKKEIDFRTEVRPLFYKLCAEVLVMQTMGDARDIFYIPPKTRISAEPRSLSSKPYPANTIDRFFVVKNNIITFDKKKGTRIEKPAYDLLPRFGRRVSIRKAEDDFSDLIDQSINIAKDRKIFIPKKYLEGERYFNLTEARVLDDFDKFCDFIKRSDSTAEKSR